MPGPLAGPLSHAHRSLAGTSPSTCSTCAPHPRHPGLSQVWQFTRWHIGGSLRVEIELYVQYPRPARCPPAQARNVHTASGPYDRAHDCTPDRTVLLDAAARRPDARDDRHPRSWSLRRGAVPQRVQRSGRAVLRGDPLRRGRRDQQGREELQLGAGGDLDRGPPARSARVLRVVHQHGQPASPTPAGNRRQDVHADRSRQGARLGRDDLA